MFFCQVHILVISRIRIDLALEPSNFHLMTTLDQQKEGRAIAVIYIYSIRIILATHHAKNTETNDTSIPPLCDPGGSDLTSVPRSTLRVTVNQRTAMLPLQHEQLTDSM